MVDVETLEIVIDILDDFSDDLSRLSAELEATDRQIEDVDDEDIDIDIQGEGEILEAIAMLEALNAQQSRADEAIDMGGRGAFIGGGRRGGGAGVVNVSPQMMRHLDVGDLSSLIGGDEDMARRMKRFATEAEQAGKESEIFNLRMSAMHNALAKLIPLLVAFIGALPAAIAGLVGIATAAIAAAGALATVAGLGIFGAAISQGEEMGSIMENLQEIFSDILQDLKESVTPLARRFSDLGESMLEGLDVLFQRIAAQGDSMVEFKAQAMAFGAFMLDFIPEAIDAMFKMAQAFEPLFGAFADWLEQADILETFTEMVHELLPALLMFIDAFLDLLGPLIRVSEGFLWVTAIFMRLIIVVGEVIAFFLTLGGIFDENIKIVGALVAAILVLITVGSILNSVYSVMTGQVMAKLGSALMLKINQYRMLAAWTNITTAATHALKRAIISLLAVTGIGLLLAVVGSVAGKMWNAANATQTTADEMMRMDRFARRIEGRDLGGGRGAFSEAGVPESAETLTTAVERDQQAAEAARAPSESSESGGSEGDTNIEQNVNIEGTADADKIRDELDRQQYKSRQSTTVSTGGN